MSKTLGYGFIGLGDQGAPMAGQMLKKGLDVTVWARRPEALEPFIAEGAKTARSPAALGAACDLVGVCVVNDKDVLEVVAGENGLLSGMKAGGVILVHSTVSPETVKDLERLAGEKGVRLLDAPVSGGNRGGLAGTLTVMVGGDPEVLETARPMLETFAEKIFHLGPVGSGQAIKLVNNTLTYATVTLSVSALRAVRDLGMDVKQASQVLRVSSGATNGLRIITTERSLRRVPRPGGPLRKDVAAFKEMMRHAGLEPAYFSQIATEAVEHIESYAAEVLPNADKILVE